MNLKRSIFTLFLLAVLIVPAFAAGPAGSPVVAGPKADVPKADVPEADAPEADAPEADAPEADAPKVTIIYFWGDG